jgi:hypothetical protein
MAKSAFGNGKPDAGSTCESGAWGNAQELAAGAGPELKATASDGKLSLTGTSSQATMHFAPIFRAAGLRAGVKAKSSLR